MDITSTHEGLTAELLLEQATLLRKARGAERKAKRAAEQDQSKLLAAQEPERKYRHLEPEIERQLKEIGAFLQRYLGPRSTINHLQDSRKTIKTVRDPINYEYRYEDTWESGEPYATAWILQGCTISTDGTWWVSSSDKNSRSWRKIPVGAIVTSLSTTDSCTLGSLKIRVHDRGNTFVDLLVRQPSTNSNEKKLSELVVEAAVKRGEQS